MQCQVHQDRVFRTFTRTGEIIYWRRAYVITDGGYPICFSFVNPTLPNYEYHTVLWAEWLESIRKDVERLFGTLKFRFRWLMGPILYHDLETVNHAVRTYTIAYGMNDFDWDDNTDSLGLRKPMS